MQVHINLGAGESELSSPRDLRLDDLEWHEVKVSRRDADMTLTVDGVHTQRWRINNITTKTISVTYNRTIIMRSTSSI